MLAGQAILNDEKDRTGRILKPERLCHEFRNYQRLRNIALTLKTNTIRDDASTPMDPSSQPD